MPDTPPNDLVAGIDAVLWAIHHRDELHEIAYAASDERELTAELQRRHGFTTEQCEFIMSSSPRRMTREYREQLASDRAGLLDRPTE